MMYTSDLLYDPHSLYTWYYLGLKVHEEEWYPEDEQKNDNKKI